MPRIGCLWPMGTHLHISYIHFEHYLSGLLVSVFCQLFLISYVVYNAVTNKHIFIHLQLDSSFFSPYHVI